MKKTAVILVEYKSLATTKMCIQSLQKHEGVKVPAIVINNDPQTKLTKKDFPFSNIHIINSKINGGFSYGINQGIKKALEQKVDGVLVLNTDTLLTGEAIAPLWTTMGNTHSGIASPVLKFKKNKKILYDLGGVIQPLFLRTYHNEKEYIPVDSPIPAAYVSGAAMLITKEVFVEIGLFDENFFLYYEDVDFCLRAKKAGFSIVVDPAVVIEHKLSSTVKKGSNAATINQLKSALLFGKIYAISFRQKILHMLFVFAQAVIFYIKFPQGRKGVIQALQEFF